MGSNPTPSATKALVSKGFGVVAADTSGNRAKGPESPVPFRFCADPVVGGHLLRCGLFAPADPDEAADAGGVGLVEQRYQAVLEVLNDGATVIDVARRQGVARQTDLPESLSRTLNKAALVSRVSGRGGTLIVAS